MLTVSNKVKTSASSISLAQVTESKSAHITFMKSSDIFTYQGH